MHWNVMIHSNKTWKIYADFLSFYGLLSVRCRPKVQNYIFTEILVALNDTKKIRNTLILLVFAKFKALIDALEFNDPFRQNVENLCRFFVILWTVVRTSQTKSAKPHFCRQSVHIEMQGKLSVSQLYNLLTFDFILKKICSFGFIQIKYVHFSRLENEDSWLHFRFRDGGTLKRLEGNISK